MNDSVYILVLADTHAKTLRHLPEKISQLVKEVDYVVHCGDYTEIRVLEELRSLAKRFIGVYGNTDSPEVKEVLPTETTFKIYGKHLVVTHPHFGGPPWGLEEELVEQYPDADVILFGHTHDAVSKYTSGKLLFNPGQGYPIFIKPANLGILKISESEIEGRIFTADNAFLF